ncbi:GerW family sporulation protein [Ectobacillus polymachus]|uniref:GerW family sporulation protein n=1 Tax=Ectobacillus polymachus TaxID=1508806 RepID=UPI003A8383F1
MQHPIEDLMKTAMHNLKEMVDVNTIVGKPVATNDGSVILTVSKVSFGFGAGGSDFQGNGNGSTFIKRPKNKFHPNQEQEKKIAATEKEQEYPFGGGSGAGVSINPVAFLVVGEKGVQVMHLQSNTHLIEKALDVVPKAIQSIQNMRNEKKNSFQ